MPEQIVHPSNPPIISVKASIYNIQSVLDSIETVFNLIKSLFKLGIQFLPKCKNGKTEPLIVVANCPTVSIKV